MNSNACARSGTQLTFTIYSIISASKLKTLKNAIADQRLVKRRVLMIKVDHKYESVRETVYAYKQLISTNGQCGAFSTCPSNTLFFTSAH